MESSALAPYDPKATQIRLLEEENQRLNMEIQGLRSQLAVVQSQNSRAISNLRQQLGPLYKALQMVFGEMDAIGGGADPGPVNSDKWKAIKDRLAPRLREAIDVLLVQGPMKRTQLASAMRMDYSNCAKNVVAKLLQQGLLVDNGKELKLKEL